jgi:hypothetical protein
MMFVILISIYTIITYLMIIESITRIFILLPGWMMFLYSFYTKRSELINKYRVELSLLICLLSILSLVYGSSQW